MNSHQNTSPYKFKPTPNFNPIFVERSLLSLAGHKGVLNEPNFQISNVEVHSSVTKGHSTRSNREAVLQIFKNNTEFSDILITSVTPTNDVIEESKEKGLIIVCREDESLISEDNLFKRVRIGGIAFYYPDSLAEDNKSIIYNIYLCKLYARYLVTKIDTMSGSANQDLKLNDMHGLITKASKNIFKIGQKVEKNLLISIAKNIIYAFKDTETMYQYLNAFKNNTQLDINNIFHGLGLLLRQGNDFYQIPNNRNDQIDIKKSIADYVSLIALYADTKKATENGAILLANSEKYFTNELKLFLIERFAIDPSSNKYFYKSLFFGSYAYIISEGKLGSPDGHICINEKSELIYAFNQTEKILTSKTPPPLCSDTL